MRTIIGGVFSLLIISAAASASDQPDILGAGGQSCGSWQSERQSAQATRYVSSKLEAQSHWILGFITATNLALFPKNNLTEETTGSAMMYWIDNYCKEHPLDNLATATSALVLELTHRFMARKNPK